MATNLQIRLDRKLLKLQSTRSTRPGQAQPALSTTVIQRAMGGPDGLSSQDVLQLQRVLGNRAVGELLTGTLQRTIDRPRSPSSPAPQAHPTGLPDNLKAGIESLAGMSMDDVRIHYNSPKPAKVQALAYTQGADIHVAPGQEQHLAHEAWHVVQQKQGRVKPTLQLKKGVGLNDDAGLEKKADTFRRRAMQAAANSNHTWRDRAKQSGDARLAPTALRGNTIQLVIHKGQTLRSQPFGTLKLSGWYESLPSDDPRPWAYDLPRREGEHYTTDTARVAIDKHITDGDPVPTFDVDPKAERLKRVSE